MEPYDFKNMSIELTDIVADRLPAMLDIALTELAQAGGVATPKA